MGHLIFFAFFLLFLSRLLRVFFKSVFQTFNCVFYLLTFLISGPLSAVCRFFAASSPYHLDTMVFLV